MTDIEICQRDLLYSHPTPGLGVPWVLVASRTPERRRLRYDDRDPEFDRTDPTLAEPAGRSPPGGASGQALPLRVFARRGRRGPLVQALPRPRMELPDNNMVQA